MKIYSVFLVIPIVIISIVAFTSIKNTYTLAKDYSIIISGTSNLHNWSEKVETASGYGTISINSDGSINLETLHIQMDVHSIKSDMGSVMNINTYKALKGELNPTIIFALTAPIKNIKANSTEKVISAKGDLTIAGISKSVDMLVNVFLQKDVQLSFQGSQTIQLTDYDIIPPTALFGTLKTGNVITIQYKTRFLQ